MKHRFRISANKKHLTLVRDEMIQWCEDNCGGKSIVFEIDCEIVVLFACDEDAMAFKLRWI